MTRALLVRGMLVGLAAGLLAFAFAYLVGEPQVQRAIDFESQLAHATGEPHEHAEVSRGVQRTVGLLCGTVVMGAALGGLLSLVFAWCYGRASALGPRATAGALALAAYVTVVLVPFTKYPATPPAVGQEETIGRRTLLYVAMIAVSILAAIAAGRIRRSALARRGPWDAAILAGIAFVAVVVVAQLILPTVDEVPAAFPADVLYRFRLASLGTNAVMWTALGLGFGAVAERLIAPGRAPATAAVARA